VIRLLVKYRKPIFIATAAVFLIGIFVGLGGYLLTNTDASTSIAEVWGDKIPRNRFDVQVRNYEDRLRSQKQDIKPELEAKIKDEVLRDLIVEALFAHEADKMGFVVTDAEVAEDIRGTFSRDGQFDQQSYFYMVQNELHMTPEQYEAMRRRSLLAFKYRQLLQRTAKIEPGEVREEYLKEHGTLKDFEEKGPELRAQMQQQRALETLNYALRQLVPTAQIKSYLNPQS
jgi:hypothetical protein